MSATERPSQFGKRWHNRTPRRDIEAIVGNLHVSTPDADVRAAVQARIDKAIARDVKKHGRNDWTPLIVRQSLDFAVLVHRANQDLFRHVMSGRVG